MNKEQMEQIAIQATNNYFNLLDQNQKNAYAMNLKEYIMKYNEIYNIALGEIKQYNVSLNETKNIEQSQTSLASMFR